MGNPCSKEENEFHEGLRVDPVHQALLAAPVFLLDYLAPLPLVTSCKSGHNPVASVHLDIWLSSASHKEGSRMYLHLPWFGVQSCTLPWPVEEGIHDWTPHLSWVLKIPGFHLFSSSSATVEGRTVFATSWFSWSRFTSTGHSLYELSENSL